MISMTKIYRFLSLNLWGNLPSSWQRNISNAYASIYNRSFTRHFIVPYCKINYTDKSYLEKFRSETGADHYASFQDFFVRVYKDSPTIASEYIWPCEGLLCDYGQVSCLPAINVKGDKRNVRVIFGQDGKKIPNHYFFSNIFLHNSNYHRIHTPVDCTIEEIEYIKGDLVLLRPWVYKQDPSLPAIRNERVNVTLRDFKDRRWFVSIVGGPAVGSIVLNQKAKRGQKLKIGEELGKFLLGSTCCIAAPEPMQHTAQGSMVSMGDPY